MWTRRSYFAIYLWAFGNIDKRDAVKKILIDDNLTKEVQELENASTLKTWYNISNQAFDFLNAKRLICPSDKYHNPTLEQILKM